MSQLPARRRARLRARPVTALAVALSLCAAPFAQAEPFTGLAPAFDGSIRASGIDRAPITAGTDVTVSGSGLIPGQTVTLRSNGAPLTTAAPITVDADGAFETTLTLPEAAEPGTYPVVAELDGPDYAMIVDLKISPVLPETGSFDTVDRQLAPGLYQVARAADGGALYVTSAVGRPPVTQSELLKLDPETFDIIARTTPQAAPAREDGRDGGLYAVYGVGIAAEAGQVWVSNTRQDTVAVYDADDLSLLKQFEPGTIGHPRDVVEYDGKVYVSATFLPEIHVFDAESMTHEGVIELTSSRRRTDFGTASLQLDADRGRLFVVSLTSDEVAVVDLTSGTQSAVWPLAGSKGTIGVGYDPKSDRIFTAGQGSDNVQILDAASGELLHDVPVGANPLNIAVDPDTGTAFVAVRGSHSVVTVTPEGEVTGTLTVGSLPNHLIADGAGGVLLVNKRNGEDDPSGDHITRITPQG